MTIKDRKVQLSDANQIKMLSIKMGCPEIVLRRCLYEVGVSERALEAYWSMNKDRLLWQYNNQKLSNEP